jgi:hypothetical protein
MEHSNASCYLCMMERVRMVDGHLPGRASPPTLPSASPLHLSPPEINVVEVTRKMPSSPPFPSSRSGRSRRKGDGVLREAVFGLDF